jgi:hypothetical protein
MSQSSTSSPSGKSIVPSIGGYIAAFIVLGGWSAANLRHMSDLSDKEAAFQQYKTIEEGKLRERELQLNKQKLELETRSKDLTKSENEIALQRQTLLSQATAVQGREEQLLKASHAVGAAEQLAKEKTDLNALMNKVAELGADLRNAMPCDLEGRRKYIQAKTLVKQIETRATAAGLYDQYERFIRANTHFTLSSDEDCN